MIKNLVMTVAIATVCGLVVRSVTHISSARTTRTRLTRARATARAGRAEAFVEHGKECRPGVRLDGRLP